MTPADSVQTSNYPPTQENSSHSESTDNVSNHYTNSTCLLYTSYVQANYLNVPDGLPSLEAAVQVIQDENGDLSLSQWIAQIKDTLWKTCTYQKDNLESCLLYTSKVLK